MTDLSRYADFLDFLDEQHVADPDLRAAWVGGSAATGGYDDHSDLDVNVLAATGTFTEVYGRLSRSLTTRFSPTSLWELPEATYLDAGSCSRRSTPIPAAWTARPGWSTSWSTSPPTSTVTSTYAATARRWSVSTPTG